VDNAGNVTQDGEENIDQEVAVAAALKEHSERGEEDGEDDLDDVAVDLVLAFLSSLVLGGKAPNEINSSRNRRERTHLPVKGMAAVDC